VSGEQQIQQRQLSVLGDLLWTKAQTMINDDLKRKDCIKIERPIKIE
jgi:hypothetical protein